VISEPTFKYSSKSPCLTSLGAMHIKVNTIEDDHLSVAALPANPASEQVAITHTSTQAKSVDSPIITTAQPLPNLTQPVVPPIQPGSRRR